MKKVGAKSHASPADERNPAEMKAMLKLLEETAPGMGVALADNHKSYKEYPDQLTDLCAAHGATVEPEDQNVSLKKVMLPRGTFVAPMYSLMFSPFPIPPKAHLSGGTRLQLISMDFCAGRTTVG